MTDDSCGNEQPIAQAADGHRLLPPQLAFEEHDQVVRQDAQTQRRFGGHTSNFGKAAVKRACYAADRTGRVILDTLWEKCLQRHVEFFN